MLVKALIGQEKYLGKLNEDMWEIPKKLGTQNLYILMSLLSYRFNVSNYVWRS